MKKKKDKKKSSFFADFKAFLNRGNIMDLAVAVIIGAAFGAIVTALVNQIIMPLLSLALGGISFKDLKWIIREGNETQNITEVALGYGEFIQALIDFIIIAFCIFMLIRIIAKAQNKLTNLTKKEETPTVAEEQPLIPTVAEEQPLTPPPPTQEELLAEIRDLLKQNTEIKNK